VVSVIESFSENYGKLDKKQYAKTITENLSKNIIEYLGRRKKEYVATLNSSPVIEGVKINTVTISEKGFFGLKGKRICELNGYQTFHDPVIGSNPIKIYDNVKLEAKIFDHSTLSQKSLDSLLKDINYQETLEKAENGYYQMQYASMIGEAQEK